MHVRLFIRVDDDHVDGITLVSELQSPTDLLFNPQKIYENGKPWWNNIDR
jgi:hypothetical protein